MSIVSHGPRMATERPACRRTVTPGHLGPLKRRSERYGSRDLSRFELWHSSDVDVLSRFATRFGRTLALFLVISLATFGLFYRTLYVPPHVPSLPIIGETATPDSMGEVPRPPEPTFIERYVNWAGSYWLHLLIPAAALVAVSGAALPMAPRRRPLPLGLSHCSHC